MENINFIIYSIIISFIIGVHRWYNLSAMNPCNIVMRLQCWPQIKLNKLVGTYDIYNTYISMATGHFSNHFFVIVFSAHSFITRVLISNNQTRSCKFLDFHSQILKKLIAYQQQINDYAWNLSFTSRTMWKPDRRQSNVKFSLLT